ncbi:hypothetical protein [Paraburkholderia sp. RL17-381-BIF-C]|uniref:hypothetical protein n=1 Tax=Paraburkholderia sp. RL17-381-BIF-C TaxID=3031635 RepID=UPI0038B7793A
MVSLKLTSKRWFPLHVYPQSNDRGWEITKIRILLQRNNAETALAMHCCSARPCEMDKNVQTHKPFCTPVGRRIYAKKSANKNPLLNFAVALQHVFEGGIEDAYARGAEDVNFQHPEKILSTGGQKIF